jgi:hypothetical protein
VVAYSAPNASASSTAAEAAVAADGDAIGIITGCMTPGTS